MAMKTSDDMSNGMRAVQALDDAVCGPGGRVEVVPTLIEAHTYEPGDYPPMPDEDVRAPVAEPAPRFDDMKPGCLCHQEEGDSPCPVHPSEDEDPGAVVVPLWLARLNPEQIARINAIPATGPAPWDIADGALAKAIAGSPAEPAPREPSAPTGDAGELARLLPGLAEKIKIALFIIGPNATEHRGWQIARACKLLLGERERLTRENAAAEERADAWANRAAEGIATVKGMRARVDELEAERAKVPAAVAYVFRGDRILSVTRRGTDERSAPGGKLDPDETPEQAARRELREETGLVATSARLVYVGYGPSGRLVHAFLVTVDDGAYPAAIETGTRVEWVAPDVLASSFAPEFHREGIAAALTERARLATLEATPPPRAFAAPLAVRPIVASFALAMEESLRANDHKGGWKHEAPSALLSRLNDESIELRRAVGGERPDARDSTTLIRHEAADVANFAMMIADNEGELATAHHVPAPHPFDGVATEVLRLPPVDAADPEYYLEDIANLTNADCSDMRDTFIRITRLGLAGMLACDAADGGKEPG